MEDSFVKTFEPRWSDLDANRHVTNTAYNSFLIETRMAFLKEHGFTHQELSKHKLGPAIIHEELFYLKELKPSERAKVSLQLKGITADNRFLKFAHTIFNENGDVCVVANCTFFWMDLEKRKVAIPPQTLLDVLNKLSKADGFKILSKEDLPKIK